MALRLVADDLTGALDSAAQFCGAVGPLQVLVRPISDRRWDTGKAVAMNLACRDGLRDDAALAAARAAPFLGSGDLAFKKIDSLLRGHWAAELAATLATGFGSCVLAPAFPAQGRITSAGRQFLRSESGALVEVGPPIRDQLATERLQTAEGSGQHGAGPPRVHVFDAASREDLARVVEHGRRLPGPVLWCGSAGLASALAGIDPPRPSMARLAQPVLVLIGTDHPVARAQVVRALEGRAGIGVGLGPRRDSNLAEVRRALGSGHAVVTVDIPGGWSREDAARLVDERLRGIVPVLEAPGTLVVAGGETLLSACDALGSGSLTVEGELSPGIPVSRMADGRWTGTRVVSKSGAFGDANLLASMLFG